MKPKSVLSWNSVYSDSICRIVFLASIIFIFIFSAKGWNSNLSSAYVFRQAQTAISVKYLLNGGPWLAYETPIFGPPWSAPLEFPLYQWLVALMVKFGVFPIVQAGRFVSEMFFFSTLYPLFKILEILKFSKKRRFIILSLYCVSPLYLFWSRTFLIESTALAMSVYYIWMVMHYLDQLVSVRRGWFLLAGIAITGSLAGMVKITTFYAFFVSALVIITIYIFRAYREKRYFKQPILLLLIFSLILPFIAACSWTAYADSVKRLNHIAQCWTSASLQAWNFGPMMQRFDPGTWKILFFRTMVDVAGDSRFAMFCIILTVFCQRSNIRLVLSLISFFLLAQLTFTNLHTVHPYYPYANAIFLIVAIGIVISDFLDSGSRIKRTTGIILFSMTLFLCLRHNFNIYWKLQDDDFDSSAISQVIDENTREDDVFVVFGTGGSSDIPYSVNRRAALVGCDFENSTLNELRERLKPYHIGGILFYSRNGFDEACIAKAKTFFNSNLTRRYEAPWRGDADILMLF